jgi:hypothetical protein
MANSACSFTSVTPVARAELLGGVDDEPAPAAADVEQRLALAEAHLLADSVVLVLLELPERVLGRLLVAARVAHRLVEDELEHVVARAVVERDVRARVAEGVLHAARGDAHGEAEIAADVLVDVRPGEDEEQVRQRADLEGEAAVEVRLAQAEVAERQRAAAEVGVGHAHHDVRLLGGAGAAADVVHAVGHEEADARRRDGTVEHTEQQVVEGTRRRDQRDHETSLGGEKGGAR